MRQHVFVSVSMHACVCMYMFMRACASAHVCVCLHAHVPWASRLVCACNLLVFARTRMYICVRVCVCTHSSACVAQVCVQSQCGCFHSSFSLRLYARSKAIAAIRQSCSTFNVHDWLSQ
jgi:hypothetical protein